MKQMSDNVNDNRSNFSDTCTPNPGKVEPTALRLKKKLLCGYDRRVRPRNLNDGSTLVEIELIVQYLRYVSNQI